MMMMEEAWEGEEQEEQEEEKKRRRSCDDDDDDKEQQLRRRSDILCMARGDLKQGESFSFLDWETHIGWAWMGTWDGVGRYSFSGQWSI